MSFNGGMTIWILAILILAVATLAGWRQGAIRAAFATVGILFATLLAVPVGKLAGAIWKIFGVSSPITLWAMSPLTGFILVSIVFAVIAHQVHKRVEHFYKYEAGDLRLALWTRMNTRLGICLGVLNGAMYFVLITFLIFNLTYLTTQVAVAANQPATIRLVNQLGSDLDASGLSRTANAVGKMPAKFYQLSDLSGFLMQNPQVGPRLAEYPAFTSLWERDDMLFLVSDPALTNALASGATLGEIMNNPNVQSFIKSKDQTKLVLDLVDSNLDDLTAYLQTGKSAKYDGQKIIGHWEFNPSVTLAWMRQNNPKIPASEMRAIRAQIAQAYAPTRVIVAGDNQLFVKGWPKFKVTPGQPPTTEYNDLKGDWSANGNSYDLHVTGGGDEKFMTGTAEDLRLTVKDGKNLLIFDRAD